VAIFGSASKPEKKRRLHQDHNVRGMALKVLIFVGDAFQVSLMLGKPLKKGFFRAFVFAAPGIVPGVLGETWCPSGATVFDVFGIAFGNISNKLLAEVHGNRTRCFFATDRHRISSLDKFLLTAHSRFLGMLNKV